MGIYSKKDILGRLAHMDQVAQQWLSTIGAGEAWLDVHLLKVSAPVVESAASYLQDSWRDTGLSAT